MERIRSVVQSSKYGPYYTTRIWVRNGPQPALISIPGRDAHGYLHTIGHFAHRVATLGGLELLERGSSIGGALAPPLLMSPVLLGGVAVSIFALANEPWYQRFAPTFVGLALFAVMVWVARITWPRPVRDWDEYVAALQGLKGQRA